MASIEKRGEKYTVRWRDAGGSSRRRTCPNLTTARALKREVEEDLALGAATWRPRAEAEAPDLPVIFQAYLDDRARSLAASTLSYHFNTLQVFLAYLRSELPQGRLFPDLLSRKNLAGFHTHLLKFRKISLASAEIYIRRVEMAWRWASDSDDFERVVPRPKSLVLPKLPPTNSPAVQTWAVCDQVILKADQEEYARFFTVLRYTGLRQQQAMRLRWEDFDFEKGLMTIRPELGKTRLEKRGRVVPVTPHLLRALEAWGPASDGWAIENTRKKRRPYYAALRRQWSAVGVTQPQPCHAFRKAFVTGLVELGVQEQIIRALVGHTRGLTLDVYSDLRAVMGLMQKAVALIPEIGSADGCAHRVPNQDVEIS